MERFNQCFTQHYLALVAIAKTKTDGKMILEGADLVGELYMHLWNKISEGKIELKKIRNMYSYILKSLHNYITDQSIKKFSKCFSPIEDHLHPSVDTYFDYENNDFIHFLLNVVLLSDLEMEYLLFVYLGYQRREIAQELGITSDEARKVWQRITPTVSQMEGTP